MGRTGTGRSVLATLAVLLLAAGPLAQRAPAAPGDFDYHWGRRDRGSLELRLGENLDGDWERDLQRAIGAWERSGVIEARVVRGSTSPAACAENRGQVEVCNADYGDTGWLGLTRIAFDGNGHTTAATVRLNDHYFAPGGRYDSREARRHTMCHELGHAFGLAGHLDTGSCMNDSEPAIFGNPDPVPGDFRDLERIYGHRDDKRDATVGGGGGRAAGVGAAGGGVVDVEQSAAAASSAGRHTHRVDHLPGGRTVVTFTSWAT